MVQLAGGFIAGVLLIAGCSGSESTELPAAFDGVCTPERGCQFTSAVAEAACDELGNPDRIGLRVGETAIESITVYETYPSVVRAAPDLECRDRLHRLHVILRTSIEPDRTGSPSWSP